MRHWDGFACWDIHTKFRTDWFRHSNIEKGVHRNIHPHAAQLKYKPIFISSKWGIGLNSPRIFLTLTFHCHTQISISWNVERTSFPYTIFSTTSLRACYIDTDFVWVMYRSTCRVQIQSFRTAYMFMIFPSKVLHTHYICGYIHIFTFTFLQEFQISNSNRSIIISIKSAYKYSFHATPIFLSNFYRYALNKIYICSQNLLPYIISGSNINVDQFLSQITISCVCNFFFIHCRKLA
jgi:hypothetical protein